MFSEKGIQLVTNIVQTSTLEISLVPYKIFPIWNIHCRYYSVVPETHVIKLHPSTATGRLNLYFGSTFLHSRCLAIFNGRFWKTTVIFFCQNLCIWKWSRATTNQTYFSNNVAASLYKLPPRCRPHTRNLINTIVNIECMRRRSGQRLK